MSIAGIFPVVIARDEPALLELTLASLREFPEVIVLARDARPIIDTCAAYPNSHLIERDDLAGGDARNHAAGAAAGPWILSLTAGEFLSDALLASLKQLELTDADRVYAVERQTLFMGHTIRWGGWGRRWPVRVYYRHRYRFSEPQIDERLALATNTRITTLKGTLWFEAVASLDALLRETGERARLRRRADAVTAHGMTVALRAVWAFVASYIFKLGFLEGRRGLVIAATYAIETFFRLAPWQSHERALRIGLPLTGGRNRSH